MLYDRNVFCVDLFYGRVGSRGEADQECVINRTGSCKTNSNLIITT